MFDYSEYLKTIGKWHITGPPDVFDRPMTGGGNFAFGIVSCDTGDPGYGPPHTRPEPVPYFGEEITPCRCEYCDVKSLPEDRLCVGCGAPV